ncbi:MAG: hypothetical protein ACHQ1F_03635 [Spirochaetia bacterium]
MKAKQEYVPGVCNIGPAEIRRRMQSGWIGLGATILLWTAFVVFQVPAAWRLLIFIPAATGAAGFLQACLHFCAEFGVRGVFNFASAVGKTETVEQAEFRRMDRRKAGLIALYAALIGAATAIAAGLLVI